LFHSTVYNVITGFLYEKEQETTNFNSHNHEKTPLTIKIYGQVENIAGGIATRILAGRSGVRIPLDIRDFSLHQNLQTGDGMGTGVICQQ
jgi:hypothetical protein